MASSRFNAAVIAQNPRGELLAVDLAAGVVPGNAASIAAPPRPHRAGARGVGVMHRHALLREKRAVVDLPMPMEPVRPRMNIVNSARQLSRRRKSQQRQKRQTKDREIIALDPLEQMDAGLFQLIGADACDAPRRPPVSRYCSRNLSEKSRIVSRAASACSNKHLPSRITA